MEDRFERDSSARSSRSVRGNGAIGKAGDRGSASAEDARGNDLRTPDPVVRGCSRPSLLEARWRMDLVKHAAFRMDRPIDGRSGEVGHETELRGGRRPDPLPKSNRFDASAASEDIRAYGPGVGGCPIIESVCLAGALPRAGMNEGIEIDG